MSQSADVVHAELRDLHERLVACLVATVPPMLEGHADEELYALALVTDSDVITCRLSAQTEQLLAAVPDYDDEPEYYRWWPEEWSIHDDECDPVSGGESSVELSRVLFELERQATASGMVVGDWRNAAREVLHSALGHEQVAQALTDINPLWAPVLFVMDSDGDQWPTVTSIDELNDDHPRPELVAEVRQYYVAEAEA
ncbi:DUF4303 domain-containing protein [Propionibacteriaceae bacterium Y1923]|uniref:DUF4303 domain-containing protein n=1 Tax=Aestuariimicrobium sp. Y1814 TaxID=3418742 RepID=UPI003C2867EB